MKTKKSVERSPIQMMIVSFVIIFAFITGTILFMYFKWFASDELAAPAAVNVVGDGTIGRDYSRIYSIDFPKEGLDKIKVTPNAFIVLSRPSHNGNFIAYVEAMHVNGESDNINFVIWDVLNNKKLYSKQVLPDNFGNLLLPVAWSSNDENIILGRFRAEGDFVSLPTPMCQYLLNLKTLDEKIFGCGNAWGEGMLYFDNNQYVVYFDKTFEKGSCTIPGPGWDPYNDLIYYNNANTGEKVLLVAGDDEVFFNLVATDEFGHFSYDVYLYDEAKKHLEDGSCLTKKETVTSSIEIEAVCGNGILEVGEQCDGVNLRTYSELVELFQVDDLPICGCPPNTQTIYNCKSDCTQTCRCK